MAKKCSFCGKNIKIPESIEKLNLAQVVCEQCINKGSKAGNHRYLTDHGEIEVIKFKAVTQEKSMQITCNKCKEKIHTMDALIFIDCRFRYSDGCEYNYASGYIIPPEKYFCPMAK